MQGKGFRARGFRAYPCLVTSCLGKEMKVPSARWPQKYPPEVLFMEEILHYPLQSLPPALNPKP